MKHRPARLTKALATGSLPRTGGKRPVACGRLVRLALIKRYGFAYVSRLLGIDNSSLHKWYKRNI